MPEGSGGAEAQFTDESTPAPAQVGLSKRLRSPRTIVSFLLAAAFIFFVFRNLNLDFGEILRNIVDGNPFWIAAAFAAYYGVFPVRSWRWRAVMKNAGIYDGSPHSAFKIGSLSEIFVLSWFANCLVPAKLGDAYRGYLMRERAGVSFAATLGTIVAERFIDVVALVTLMVTAALVIFGSDVPDDVQFPLIGGGALVILGVIGLAIVARYYATFRPFMPARFSEPLDRLQGGVVSSFSRREALPIVLATAIIWAAEGVRVYCVAAAFGVRLSIAESLFVALLASLLTVVPLTPAGLGVVESGTIIALRLLDVSSTDAATIAIVDRVVAYWSVILVGGALSIIVRRR